MCHACDEKIDEEYLVLTLDHYKKVLQEDPERIICEDEVNSTLLRLHHGLAQKEILWLGGEKPVAHFVEMLQSL